MKTYLDCMVCFVRHALDSIRRLSDDPLVHERVMRQVLEAVAAIDLATPPPVMGQTTHRIIREALGVADPYAEAKKQFSDFARGMEDPMRERLMADLDPVGFAVRLAIAGNIIDLGIHGTVDEAEVHDAIDHALAAPLDPAEIRRFIDEARCAKEILYLADNAGELNFDKLLIEQLPREKVILVVKERPIINDATMIEAREAGLTDLVRVITNGTDAPGTVLDQCSEEFVRLFHRADMVISKGQGNFEMLNDTGRPIWFLLKVKCPMVAAHLNRTIGDITFQKLPANCE